MGQWFAKGITTVVKYYIKNRHIVAFVALVITSIVAPPDLLILFLFLVPLLTVLEGLLLGLLLVVKYKEKIQ